MDPEVIANAVSELRQILDVCRVEIELAEPMPQLIPFKSLEPKPTRVFRFSSKDFGALKVIEQFEKKYGSEVTKKCMQTLYYQQQEQTGEG